MKTKLIFSVLLFFAISTMVRAQLNEYKYIIVPKKFAAFNNENKYNTSTLVKFYLAQRGFNVVYDDDLPIELAGNRCLGLVSDIIDESSMFTTKLYVTLKDCKNVEVYRTFEGISKVKEYNLAYKEALEQAMGSFDGMDYSYQSKQAETPKDPVVIRFKDDVKKVVEQEKENVVEHKATTEEQVYKSVEPRPSNITKAIPVEGAEPVASDLLYAQPTETGYQLVDSSPKVVLKLESTSMDNIFLTQFEGNNAVVFNKDGKWILEYQENGNKHQKELNIKF